MTVHLDRSLRLPDDEYFAERERKTGIAIHHTVCGAAHTTIELWRDDPRFRNGDSSMASSVSASRFCKLWHWRSSPSTSHWW